MPKERDIEITFITILSVIVFVIFYTLISMNGVVLGNDPSVHLQKAQIFLQTGKISLANLGWTPPLYEIILAMAITFSGASGLGQQIFLVKILAVIIDWLLFLSVYLIGSKFFSRKVGAVAAILLLMCFPIYEGNAFGGYTTVLGVAFLFLVLLYIPLAIQKFGYLVVAFFAAFALVLSHQLAAFISVFAMPPILLLMLIKSKGAYLKVLIALVLGGGIAFFLYYFQAVIGYIGLVIKYVFFAITAYAYQIPAVNFDAFMVDFGFIFFFALGGIVISYFVLKATNKRVFYAILLISFFVPLFLAESYLFGLYLPFGWFIYYLTPSIVILASVSIVFIAEKYSELYSKKMKIFKKNWLKIATITLIVLVSLMLVLRSDQLYGRIMEASVYYSTSDIKAYDAGVWLSQNYPGNANVVDTRIPGYWFSIFSGKNVTAQTDQTVQYNDVAESVLSLSYEIVQPQTLVRAYEAKGDITDENYVYINQVWYRVSDTSASGNFVSFTQNGENYSYPLSELNRLVSFNDQNASKSIALTYSNENIILTETLGVQNDSYPISVSWALSPLKSSISNVTLYLSTYFDLQFNFSKAQIPGLMNWANPWDMPNKTTGGSGNSNWAVASFSNSDLRDSYIGIYDEQKQVAFAFKFKDLPDWGNVGALGNRQIDAVRFQYQFDQINANQTTIRQYQILTFSQNSFPTMQQPNQLESFFDYKTSPFTVSFRDYKDYIVENNIEFIVYDKNQLDPNIASSKFLQLVYSNDRYDIFKVQGD